MGFSSRVALASVLFCSAFLERSLAVESGTTVGNWRDLDCDAVGYWQSFASTPHYTPSDRWRLLDCENAWNDAITVWKTEHRNKVPQMTFTKSIWDTLGLGPDGNCETIRLENHCRQARECYEKYGVGPAPSTIHGVLVDINRVHFKTVDAARAVANYAGISYIHGVQSFFKTFSPFPDLRDENLKRTLVDNLRAGAAMLAAPYFYSKFNESHYAAAVNLSREDLQDLTYTALSPFLSTADDVARKGQLIYERAVELNTNFTSFLAELQPAWGNATEAAVRKTFDGSDESIQSLTTLMSDGKMTYGFPPYAIPSDDFEPEVWSKRVLWTTIFGAMWSAPSSGVFVLDSGYTCDHRSKDPLVPLWMGAETANTTSACYDDRLYYLVRTGDGNARECSQVGCGDVGCAPAWNCVGDQFVAPNGVEYLGSDFGYISVNDFVSGSIRAYESNGRKNGAGPIKLDRPTLAGFMHSDVSTPGHIRIPVCGAEEALKNWVKAEETGKRYPGFPCNKLE